MNLINKLSLFFLIFLSISCSDKESQTWLKGNLHTHSYWSDGDEFPEVILDWYKSNDYDFIALSDHNTMSDSDKWVTISLDSLYQNAFNNYLTHYGEDWVNYRLEDSNTLVKLKTYEEYRSLIEEPNEFLIIQSEEITDGFEGKPVHMNATNLRTLINPQGGNSVLEVMQNNLNEVLNQRELLNIPMIPHINHPNFGYGIDLEDMKNLDGERFFEVYNGHNSVNNLGDSSHISMEEMWDLINISYLINNKPLMYGLATDDSHHYHQIGNKWANAGRGWIMVETDDLSASSLILAMESGRFYSSTGVELMEEKYGDNSIHIGVKKEKGVSYTITFLGCKKGNPVPEEFISIDGSQASFEITEDILFVRARITSTKEQENPIENMKYEMAWTQPILPSP